MVLVTSQLTAIAMASDSRRFLVSAAVLGKSIENCFEKLSI